ncbi:MAG: hypothetical protein AB1403_17385 [Candidatus Riflebacteria bacterium]
MKFKGRKGTNLLELLLALSILSGALYPIVYIFRMAQPVKKKTQTEFLATLLTHHIIETIVASKIANPDYLPPMTETQPIVQSDNAVANVSDYFRHISDQGETITESDTSQLYWSLKQFSCRVDTYYLEGFLYKAIVYITYEKDGRPMKVFLERLLSQPLLGGNDSGSGSETAAEEESQKQ